MLRKKRQSGTEQRLGPGADGFDMSDFRRLWTQCSGFHAQEPQEMLADIFDSKKGFAELSGREQSQVIGWSGRLVGRQVRSEDLI